MEKYPTKAQLMWEVSKEAEKNLEHHSSFRCELCWDKLKLVYKKEEVDELFKLIRGAEYRRGKEDGIKLIEKSESYKKSKKALNRLRGGN